MERKREIDENKMKYMRVEEDEKVGNRQKRG
jgi:hypothetical protein